MAPRIPLTVIGGFLGAGKTTLLNRMLQDSSGERLAVLVNDFGEMNIDAALVASSGADTIALTNGCVCCSIGGDLSAALVKVLAATPPPGAVVIEASGVSDPWRIAQIGLADPDLELDGVIVLVDASAVLDQARDPLLADSLSRQLAHADLVVINRTDLAESGAIARVRAWVTECAGNVAVFEATQADVPAPLLRGTNASAPVDDARCDHDPHDHHHHHGDHSQQYARWSCRPRTALSTERLRAALRNMPAGVLRLKGIVRTDAGGWAEVQFAGRHGSLRATSTVPADGAAVVAIGLPDTLPVTQLDAIFRCDDAAGPHAG